MTIVVGDRKFSLADAVRIARAEIFEHAGGCSSHAYQFADAIFKAFFEAEARRRGLK